MRDLQKESAIDVRLKRWSMNKYAATQIIEDFLNEWPREYGIVSMTYRINETAVKKWLMTDGRRWRQFKKAVYGISILLSMDAEALIKRFAEVFDGSPETLGKSFYTMVIAYYIYHHTEEPNAREKSHYKAAKMAFTHLFPDDHPLLSALRSKKN